MTTTALARSTDLPTSKMAAKSVRPAPNAMRLLSEFAKKSQTSEDAGTAAGLLHTGYWKRVSDLVRAGYIVPRRDPKTDRLMMRTNTSGRKAQVWIITGQGRAALSEYHKAL